MTVKAKTTVAIILSLSFAALSAASGHAADFSIVDGQTVIDQAGRRIRIAKPFERIISLYGAHTENLFALGAGSCVIGVSPLED